MSFHDNEPIFAQVAQMIRDQVLSRVLSPGDKLMATTAFAAAYRINPGTVTKALGILVDEGLVEKRRGIGMFVATDARDVLIEKERATYLRDVLVPAVERGLMLGVSPDDMRDAIASAASESATSSPPAE